LKLEKGSQVGTIDRLLGSMTIVQTFLTQIQMRSWSLLGLLILAIWSLSPLGSQASLRIIGSTVQPTDTNRQIQYVDTRANPYQGSGDVMGTAGTSEQANAIFTAVILGRPSNSSASIDTWGNVKIPWIERMDRSTADPKGWYPIPQLNSSDDFTSLIGIPSSAISFIGNSTTSFAIQTSYWNLSCPVFRNLGNGRNVTGGHDDALFAALKADVAQFVEFNGTGNMTALPPQSLYLSSVDAYRTSDPWRAESGTPLRLIKYADNNNSPGQYVGAECTIKTIYVEVSILCSKGSCIAVKIRDSRKFSPAGSWTRFDLLAGTFREFARAFTDIFAPVSTAAPYQMFIIDPLNPFAKMDATPALTDVVSNATFALRLGQLFNTYSMARLSATVILKGLQVSPTLVFESSYNGITLDTTAYETRYALVLKCNTIWFVVLLLSSAVTAVIGLCGLIAAAYRLGPDIGFNVSSLVRDNPFVDQTSVATTLGGTYRSRLMRNWYAKLGDVAAEDEVGHIAIGSGNVADLQRGRLYR
jgi:hypothetical protein